DVFLRTRAAAQAAADAQERLASVLAGVNDMVLMLDRDLRYTYVNDRMVEASGIPREEIVGKTLTQGFPDPARSLLESEFCRSVQEHAPVHFEFFHESYDRWFDNRAYPTSDGLMLVTTEVTKTRRAEEAIRRQVGMLEAILSASVDHIYVLDRTGR